MDSEDLYRPPGTVSSDDEESDDTIENVNYTIETHTVMSGNNSKSVIWPKIIIIILCYIYNYN